MGFAPMTAAPALDYLQATQPWHSAAGTGPLLRGRRTAAHGPMLHFLHGNGFCGGVYWPFLRGLLPDYSLFCHDLEGHGASEAPARYSGTPAIIERVPRVIAEQCAQATPLFGIGHSFGAAVTLAVAARHPGLFKALVLLDPILLPPATWVVLQLAAALGKNPMAAAARRRRDRWASRAEALQRLHERGIYRGWRADALACFVDHATCADDHGRRLCCPRELEAAIFEQPVYPWRLLPRVNCPVLFVYGASSYPFFPAAARRAQRLNAGVEVQTLPGGHCFMQEDPETTTATVRTFLQRHCG